MKRHLLVLPLFLVSWVQAKESLVQPAVNSVAMFKNGLTVVSATFKVEQPGDFVWVDPPNAVHGAFWVEGGEGLVVRSTTRMVEPKGQSGPSGFLQKDLGGARVSVTLFDAGKMTGQVTGTVWRSPLADGPGWNTRYATVDGNRYLPGYGRAEGTAGVGRDWLVLETPDGRTYLATNHIGRIQIQKEPPTKVKVKSPVLVFSAKQAGVVHLKYLTKGMAWAPSYQVDLLAEDRLRIRQSAVVRNELMDLDGATLELISGYPNVKFGHVDSPLSPQATLAAFFQQLSSQGGGGGRGVVTQQIAFNSISNGVSASAPLSQPDAGAPAEDLHYENIGAHDLLEGDSLSLQVASGEVSCERIVEWVIPDSRDQWGRMHRNDSSHEEPWDAVRFTNPLKFPMTTAAASILEKNRFRGQSMVTWTSPGQLASIKINKALTVRGEHSEVEEEGEREPVWIAGRSYRRTKVKGTIKVTNSRGNAVKMVIRGEFSGELLDAEGKPEATLRREGVSSVNPRRRLEWTIDLPAGQSESLIYRYSVLVNR